MNILMYDPTEGEAGLLPTLERAVGIKFASFDAPSGNELVARAAQDARQKIK